MLTDSVLLVTILYTVCSSQELVKSVHRVYNIMSFTNYYPKQSSALPRNVEPPKRSWSYTGNNGKHLFTYRLYTPSHREARVNIRFYRATLC